MNCVIQKSRLSGSLAAIPSKSFAHRMMICAALCEESTEIEGVIPSGDINATLSCIKALCCSARLSGEKLTITPLKRAKTAVFDCGESGSTYRFMLPVAAACGGEFTFIGGGRLAERPMGGLISALESGGAVVSGSGLPLKISGKLWAKRYKISGNVSSQYLTGLLLAAPLIGGDVNIEIEGELKSADYINITLSVMKAFGVAAERRESGYFIPGGQKYKSPKKIWVEGDWSNAAFILAGGLLAGETAVTGLNPQTLQGDKKILEVFRMAGGDIKFEKGAYIAKKSRISGFEADLEGMIDAAPVLAFTAAAAEGTSFFTGVERLRFKESDRLLQIINNINAIGGRAEYDGKRLKITGAPELCGTVDGANDHRIVMAAIILGAKDGNLIVNGIEAADKSYPGFIKDFKAIGGVISEKR